MKTIKRLVGCLIALSLMINMVSVPVLAEPFGNYETILREVSEKYGIPNEVLQSKPKAEVEELYNSIDESDRNRMVETNKNHESKASISLIAETFDLPIQLVESIQEDRIEELFKEANNSVLKERKIFEFITDQDGVVVPVERSESDYYNYVLNSIKEEPDLIRDSSATTSTSDCSWMRVTVNLNKNGRWNYGISGTYRWLESRNPLYHEKDLLTLTWKNGMYMPDTAYGYNYYGNVSGFHTENLTDFAVPEENPKSVNCLKDMTDSDKKYDEQFFIHATIRKKASSYYETASATYSKQVLNIDWSTIAGVVSGATALAACIYVVSPPTSVAVLGVISAIAAIINSLGGINSCYAKVNINTSDYFNDPVGKDLEEFVGVFYDVCLKRSPDATGLTNWVNGLYNGQLGGGQVGYGFFFSQEYINQNQNYYNYVAELYRAMLHRDGSLNEIGVWTNALGSGYTREQVFHGFENSTEFAALCGNYGITP